MKSEQLKREFAEKWKHGFAFYSGHQEQHFMTELDTLIEAVIAERMPTEEEVYEEFQFDEDIDFVSDLDIQITASRMIKWFRSRMEGGK